jgi:hypothetical protein
MDRATLFKDVVRWLDDHGYSVELYEEYSGRGMYGTTTPAISGDITGVTLGVAFAAVAYSDHDTHPSDLFDDASFPHSTDSLGLGTIYY